MSKLCSEFYPRVAGVTSSCCEFRNPLIGSVNIHGWQAMVLQILSTVCTSCIESEASQAVLVGYCLRYMLAHEGFFTNNTRRRYP